MDSFRKLSTLPSSFRLLSGLSKLNANGKRQGRSKKPGIQVLVEEALLGE